MLKLTICQKAIAGACSKDSFRPAMHGVYYDHTAPGGLPLVATDGHVLVMLPCEAPEDAVLDQESYILPVSAFPKKQGNHTTVEKTGNGLTVREVDKKNAVVETRLVEVIDYPYPNYRAVVPWLSDGKSPEPTEKIGLNVEFFDVFAAIARSLNMLPDFAFTFYGPQHAVRLHKENMEGLVMPVRMK